MPWALIAEIVFEIIKLILERRKGERHALMAELAEAQNCAHDCGDTGPLMRLRERLKEGRK